MSVIGMTWIVATLLEFSSLKLLNIGIGIHGINSMSRDQTTFGLFTRHYCLKEVSTQNTRVE